MEGRQLPGMGLALAPRVKRGENLAPDESGAVLNVKMPARDLFLLQLAARLVALPVSALVRQLAEPYIRGAEARLQEEPGGAEQLEEMWATWQVHKRKSRKR